MWDPGLRKTNATKEVAKQFLHQLVVPMVATS